VDNAASQSGHTKSEALFFVFVATSESRHVAKLSPSLKPIAEDSLREILERMWCLLEDTPILDSKSPIMIYML
jgi:hypothetical protein